jgi:hypothetical protein
MDHRYLGLGVTGQDPEAIQENFTAAVDAAREQAMLGRGVGIMITQYDFDSFTVALSPDVPYGQTREQRRFGNIPGPAHSR